MYTIETCEDEKGWEKFFLATNPQALFQSWQWGEVQKKTGAQVTRFAVRKEKELVGIFQTVAVRARRGPFLHVRHGPILKTYSKELLNQCTDFLRTFAKKEHVLFVRISPLIAEKTELRELFHSCGYRPAAIHAMDAELCWVLPIEKSEDLLLQEMRKTTRYEIKKAQKLGIVIHESQDVKDLHFFFDLYKETTKRHGFVPHIGIEEEFEVFSKRNETILYYAEFEGTVIAAAIILFVGDQGIYHHGASLNSSPPGSYLIQWYAIREAIKRGMKQYNFWGIADETQPNHPWKGITLFKKGFGGEEKKYMHAQDLPVSPLYLLPRAVETIRRIKKGY